ncbi:MAG: tRNA (adenosine(37)-N6)-dimethylallyltransferase MiaA [Cyanobacteria bacterium RU_5_0]|nr:tRNA (adenosine(37)-N6)-dimethylallyltransferase MiaA [Cyanobacteria bacterium RU_5_0]
MKTNTSVLNSAVPILIVIGSPTATGKSGLALALAERLPGIILNADSRQVYREFNIGTAKPSLAEQQRVPHFLIDICDPTETLTLADYQQQAQEIIAQLHDRSATASATDATNRSLPSPPHSPIPLLVGGTGLYIRSIVRGLLIPRVAPQRELRSQLQTIGQSQCYAFLQQVDPVSAQKIHPNDQVRTLRALEVFYVTGKPISQQQGERPPNYPILQIGLDCAELDHLTHRIQQRTAQMIADGFIEEVESLCQKYGINLPLLNTLGYREMKQYLAGDLSLSQAEAAIVLHTRQFAKQQRTWFRAEPTIEWFDADAPDLLEQVWKRVQEFLQEIADGGMGGWGMGRWGMSRWVDE